jgi:hypothetical protein
VSSRGNSARGAKVALRFAKLELSSSNESRCSEPEGIASVAVIVWPVIQPALSEASRKRLPAMSSGSPSR